MANYNEHSIKSLEFGRACRERIGMYLSGDLEKAINLGIRELIYNSMDEFEMGFGNELKVEIDTKTQVIKVSDNARGIPVGIRADGSNSLTASFTQSHTGGKMDDEVYGSAVGLNGLGAKIVCHTSNYLKVWIHRDGKIYFQEFKETDDGAIPLKEVETIGTTTKTGTVVEYLPSVKVYNKSKINIKELEQTLTELSFFSLGKTFILIVDGIQKKFISKNGLADALAIKKAVHKNIIHINGELDKVKVELALQWVKEGSELLPYANNLCVREGGPFMTGFKTALTKSFNAAMGTDYSGDIIRKYLDGYVSVKVGIPKFSNQSKTSLDNPEARAAVSKITTEAIKEFFAKYPKDAEAIRELLEREQRAEKAAERAREAERTLLRGGKKARMIDNLPSKLVDATGEGYRELFIVEGNSAGGNLISMRNPATQGILPLRGKILNTYDKDLSDILKNKEVSDIMKALGCGAGSTLNLKNLRYDKVIIAVDADADGSHIELLLNSLFLTHLTPLLEQGRIYRAVTPLYGIPKGKNLLYLYSDEELNKYQKEKGLPSHIYRWKGLGSLNTELTKDVLANADSRRLEQITVADTEAAIKEFDILMGKNINERKSLVMAGGEEIEFGTD